MRKMLTEHAGKKRTNIKRLMSEMVPSFLSCYSIMGILYPIGKMIWIITMWLRIA